MKKIWDFSIFLLESWIGTFVRNGKLTKEIFTILHHTTDTHFLKWPNIAWKNWKCNGYYRKNFKVIIFIQGLNCIGDIEGGISILCDKESVLEGKISMQPVLKLSLQLNQLYIKNDLKKS